MCMTVFSSVAICVLLGFVGEVVQVLVLVGFRHDYCLSFFLNCLVVKGGGEDSDGDGV